MPDDRESSHELIRALRQLRHLNWGGKRPLDGCSPSETMMLFCIHRCSKTNELGLKASEISSIMRITSPSVTQTVNVLEARGLLERTADPLDRRVVRIKLTAEGQRLTKKAEDTMHERMQGLVEHLGKVRSTLLVQLLDEVVHYYGGVDPAPCPGRESQASPSHKEGE
ncbi:MarR family winged helix-turn-helix transcriptional regulator [Paenibacillus solisilvae]|uniref:MarR family winged helix-turn-helix transcriptional regulator n=1 Tax=Paenibacillus solisilvae TaxID=2486751 RepID=A0ABW0VUH7_9BACL